MKGYNVIIYDDENMVYFKGYLDSIKAEPNIIYSGRDEQIIGYTTTIISNNCEKSETIKLDETLMKRIAKYNKEKEIEQLDDKIKLKKEQLKALEDTINDREKRVQKLKNYIADLWNIDVDDEYEDYD